MIRLTALWLVVLGVGVVTWKDWFKGLCGLVLLVGILEYPDVPKSMFGVPGLNFFNLLLVNVLLAWMANRSRERLTWDLPGHVAALLSLYVLVILIGDYRMFSARGLMTDTTSSMLSEYVVDTFKWVVPCLLLYDGCRSRERLRLAVFALLGAYVFLGLMTIKVMPIRSAFLDGEELQRLALKLLVSRIGYHRVTLSMMLGGAAWALIAAAPLVPGRPLQRAIPLVSLVMIYAQFLTGGRGGIVTLGVIGLIFGTLKWRKVFLVAPFAVVLLYMLVPSAFDRLTQGFTKDPSAASTSVDEYELTSGRNLIWPYVIAQIGRKPLIGWGRQAMVRTGTVSFLHNELNEDFGHPHNAYLEALLDNGIIGTIPILALFLMLLFRALRLFLERRSILCAAAGGVAASTILALMVAGMSSESFYPVEGTFEMWAALGLMLRLWVERRRVLAAIAPARPALAASALGRAPAPADATMDLDALIFGGTGAPPRPLTTPDRPVPRFSAAMRAAVRPRLDASARPVSSVHFRF